MNAAAQAIYSTPALQAPWYVALLIVGFPGLLAVALTMVTIIALRRVNRADGYPPIRAGKVMAMTIAAGAVYGPLCQWAFQELAQGLTGVPLSWKLVVVAPFVTGIASMAAYEAARIYTKDRHPRIYETISVRHNPAKGHAGETAASDITELP